MPGLLYLADTNILLRLIKSNDRNFRWFAGLSTH
jgi:hypothetical protein